MLMFRDKQYICSALCLFSSCQRHVSLFLLPSGPRFIIPAPRVSISVIIGPHVSSCQRHVSLFLLPSGPRFIIPAPRVSFSVIIDRTPRFIMPAPRVSVSVIIGPHVSSFQRHVSLFLLASGPTFHRSSATCLCRYVSSSTRPIYQSK